MNIIENEVQHLAAYVADYLTEELTRQGIGYNVDAHLIETAFAAYIGGAADHN